METGGETEQQLGFWGLHRLFNLSDEARDEFEEVAAVLEFEQGLSRYDAELAALGIVERRYPRVKHRRR